MSLTRPVQSGNRMSRLAIGSLILLVGVVIGYILRGGRKNAHVK